MSKLHVDSVSHRFASKTILSDVFLSCNTGQIIGLLGRNGSGKSTLFSIIFGTLKAQSKFISVDDQIVRNVTEGRHLINYLPQNNFLPNSSKVKHLIDLFLPETERNIVIGNPHIQSLLDTKYKVLSGGEKRLLEILLLVHSQAKFILLDEPFNGLSPLMRDYVMDYLLEVKKTKGILISDHDYKNVIKLSDELYFLNNGFLKQIKDPADLVAEGYLTPNNLYDSRIRIS